MTTIEEINKVVRMRDAKGEGRGTIGGKLFRDMKMHGEDGYICTYLKTHGKETRDFVRRHIEIAREEKGIGDRDAR